MGDTLWQGALGMAGRRTHPAPSSLVLSLIPVTMTQTGVLPGRGHAAQDVTGSRSIPTPVHSKPSLEEPCVSWDPKEKQVSVWAFHPSY